jgi:hypothetical protein
VKWLWVSALLVLLLAGTVCAEETKYRVEVNIIFNAVAPEKAIAILKEALEKAGGACKFDVKVSKEGRPQEGHIYWEDLSWGVTNDEIKLTPNLAEPVDIPVKK